MDALRGWAILGVLAYHIQSRRGLPGGMLDSLLNEGWRGVQLFFVVSAFTLMRSLHTRPAGSSPSWRAFFIRRFFRLAPMFYLGAAFYFFWYGVAPRADIPDGLPSTALAQTLLFVHGWRPDTLNSVVPGSWSIAAEATFYLLLPLVFLFVRTFAQSVALLAGTCLLAALLRLPALAEWLFSAWSEPRYDYVLSIFKTCWAPAQFPVFACGIVLYFLVYDHAAWNPAALRWGALVVGGIVCLSGTLLASPPVTFALGATLLAWSLVQRPVVVLVNPVLCFLGKISFSIYLAHFAVLDLLAPLFSHAVQLPGRLQFPTLLAVSLAAVVPISALTYRLVEFPGQQWGRRLSLTLAA